MNNNTGSFDFSSVLNGLIWSLVVSICLSIIITLVLHFTAVSENLIPAFATLIFLSILSGSIVSAKTAGNKGLIHGVSVGLLYLFISLILSLFIISGSFGWLVFLKIAYTLIASSIGGIIGIGLSNQ